MLKLPLPGEAVPRPRVATPDWRATTQRDLTRSAEVGATVVRVRLSEPMLLTDLSNLLAGMLDADVRETGNELEIEFRLPGQPEPRVQVRKIEQLASAWRANGHLDVRAQIALV